MRTLYIFISIIMCCSACKNIDDLFKSYGPDTTETRQVSSFKVISAGEKFDIELRQDSTKEGTIEMTAGSHVISGYTTTVSNGVLLVENSNKFNWVRKLKVRQKVVIYFKNLDSLSVRGSAKFVCYDTIRQKNRLRIIHNGLEDVVLNIITNDIDVRGDNTGGIILSGKCNIFRGNADDISFIDNRGLITDDTYLNSYSMEDSYVDAKNILGLKVFGEGNIYYSQTPSNNTSSTFEQFGKGRIIKK